MDVAIRHLERTFRCLETGSRYLVCKMFERLGSWIDADMLLPSSELDDDPAVHLVCRHAPGDAGFRAWQVYFDARAEAFECCLLLWSQSLDIRVDAFGPAAVCHAAPISGGC